MQKPMLYLLIVLLIAPTILAQPKHTLPASLEAKVDAYIKPFLEMKAFSGAILLASKGKILLRKGYGLADDKQQIPITPTTKFQIASLSKSFTAAAILLLQERGKLNVSDALSKYIPDYPNGEKITLHHLLCHTSGIENANQLPEYDAKSMQPQTLVSIIEMFKAKPLRFTPGERYDYSNSNYNLLAFVIEKVSGQSYGAFLHANIFTPLGMKDTGHTGDDGSSLKQRAIGYEPVGIDGLQPTRAINWTIKTGNGSLYSTVEDLYKWDRALHSDKILKKSSRDLMFTKHVENAIGYGWFISTRVNRQTIRHNGRSPGYQCELQRYVNDDACVIVLGNNYSGAASFLVNELAAMLFDAPYETLTIKRTHKLDTTLFGSYQGGADFYISNIALTIAERDGNLTMKWPWGSLSWLVPVGEAKFFDRTSGGTLTFVKDEQGKVTHLMLNPGGTSYRANKM